MTAPKKSLGQNFLMHPQTASRIVHAARLPDALPVLEIGPGTGMLTRELLSAGHPVIAVEADGELLEQLAETFALEIKAGKLTLVHEDIRAYDLGKLPNPYALVANIPYYITGEIMRRFLTTSYKPESMTLLVQKEVAERIARQGKRPKESLLSLSVKTFGTPGYCFTVPKGAFRPAPKVDSAVISIQNIRKDAFATPLEEERFFELLRAGFAHRRKYLTSNLAAQYTPARVKEAFTQVGLSSSVRPEDVELNQWRALAARLSRE